MLPISLELKESSEINCLWASLLKSGAFFHYFAQTSIEWHFITPATLYFRGIWEAAIKSIKYHCKRVIGETLQAFEELSTLLSQIKATLNSRPLLNIDNSDVDCINTLTSSHFLTGDIILSTPEVQLSSSPKLKNWWDLQQKLKKDFYKAWTKTYLSSL